MKEVAFNSDRCELYNAYACIQGMPFNLVVRQWLHEALTRCDAYDFIKERGLWDEFCVYKTSH